MPVCDDTFAVLKADEDKCVVFVACLPPVEYFPEYEAKKNCWFIVHPTKDLFACLFEIGAERTMHCSYDVFDFKPHELEAVSRIPTSTTGLHVPCTQRGGHNLLPAGIACLSS